jgi:peroxiredoxin Q/BCP
MIAMKSRTRRYFGGGCAVVLALILWEEGMGIPSVGDRAPDFKATLSTGEQIMLEDYRGKQRVVLYFYPRDFTAGCTKQACSFRDSYDEFEGLNAVVIGISADSPSSHDRFVETYRLPFPLISDAERTIARLYGVTRPLPFLPTKRVTFVIDMEGVIRSVIRNPLAMRKHMEESLQVLRQDAGRILSSR